MESKKFKPGGLSTFEAATAHHKYNKESTALREVYKQIYVKNQKVKSLNFMANRDSIGTLPSEMVSNESIVNTPAGERKVSPTVKIVGDSTN